MKKKTWIILIACILVVAALVVALILLLNKESGSLDSDGDGRPDSVDVEPDDNLEGDNVTKVDDWYTGNK